MLTSIVKNFYEIKKKVEGQDPDMYLSNLDKQTEDAIKVTVTHADGSVESHFV